jgi:hypothetical protein
VAAIFFKTPRKSSKIHVYICTSDSEDNRSEDEESGISYDEDDNIKIHMNTSTNKNHRRSSAFGQYCMLC